MFMEFRLDMGKDKKFSGKSAGGENYDTRK